MIAWAFLLKHWHLALAGLGLIAVLMVAGYARHEHAVAVKAKAAQQVAVRQDKLDQATTQAVDHYTHETVVIHDKAEKASDVIHQAQGSDEPLPPAVRDAVVSGIHSLRDKPSGAADPSTGQPAGSVLGSIP